MSTLTTCNKCGCQDIALTTAPVFSPQPACPNPEPCSEAFDSKCVYYTDDDILCGTDIVVHQDDTVETALINIVDYFCNNTPVPTPEYTYEIGQYVASQGGVIFHRYKDGTTEHYLVVAVTTTTGGARWDDNIMFPLLGASSSWDGTSNYTLISAATGSQLSSAANAINYYNTVAPVTGWYLPAVDEVNLLFNNRFNINRTLSGNSSFGTVPGASEIAYNIYWTSTEVSNTQARAFEFISGTVTSVNKTTSYYVRAIRKFSI
jgi:hypothetical protein